MIRLAAACVATALCLAGPASGQSLPSTWSGLQVGLGKCVFAPPQAAKDRAGILAVIAASAISKGVNKIGAAIANAGESKTWTAGGSRNLKGGVNFPQCIQIIRGKFISDGPSNEEAWTRSALWAGHVSGVLSGNGLKLAGEPDFFFEGEFVASADNQALALRPIRSWLRQPLGSRALRSNKTRSVAVFLSFHVPGDAADLKNSPGATIVLGEMGLNQPISFARDWKDVSSPYESNWFKLAKADMQKPLTASVLVSETQSADDFLAFIGSILSDEPVQKALIAGAQQTFIPASAEARQDEEAAAIKNNSDADSKFATAIESVATCAAATKGLASEGAKARKALWDSVQAEAKSTIPRLQPTASLVNTIDLQKPSTIAARCKDVYQILTGEGIP